MKNKIFCLLLLFLQSAFAQEKMIHGVVFGMGNDVSGINVVNLVNEKSAVTDSKGEFHILAKPEDMLILSGMAFEYKRKIIAESDMRSSILVISLEPKPNQLEEVVISKYRNINAVSLGILKKHAKEYTPAERRLKTASSYDLTVGTYNSVSFDAILNSISGRTAMLKKEVNVEKKEALFRKMEYIF